MKKTGLLLLLCLVMTVAAMAQQADSPAADEATPQGTLLTTGGFPVERVQTPTNQNQQNDLDSWFPGLKPGDPIASELNPLL